MMTRYPRARRLLVAVLAFALLAAACTDDNASRPPTGEAIGSPSPESTQAPLEFLLEDRYEVGEKVMVRLRNIGRRPYIYNTAYEACEMRYFDEAGRRFIIPPGTHCDLIANEPIEPGETVTLFEWKLDECVTDRWGCVKAEPLEPGAYKIVGRFPATNPKKALPTKMGSGVRIEAAFE